VYNRNPETPETLQKIETQQKRNETKRIKPLALNAASKRWLETWNRNDSLKRRLETRDRTAGLKRGIEPQMLTLKNALPTQQL
jgi:hypothetical protein